jgi:hypothetical protein
VTRAAIIGGVDGAGSALTLEERTKIHFAINGCLKAASPEHRQQIVDRLEEVIAVERRLSEPAKADDRKRTSRLEDLEQYSKGLLNAIKDLDDDTLSSLRQQAAFSWLISIPQFEMLIAELKMTTEALSKSATDILNRNNDRRRAENTVLAPRSFLIGVVLAYYEVLGEKPPYSKGSNFIALTNSVLEALRLPSVGEDRLKGVIDDLVKTGELPSPPIKRGPKPRPAE